MYAHARIERDNQERALIELKAIQRALGLNGKHRKMRCAIGCMRLVVAQGIICTPKGGKALTKLLLDSCLRPKVMRQVRHAPAHPKVQKHTARKRTTNSNLPLQCKILQCSGRVTRRSGMLFSEPLYSSSRWSL